MDRLCPVARGYDDDTACGRPAAVQVTTACRHEHVSTAEVCEACAARLRSERMICTVCDELAVGAHLCRSALVAAAGPADLPLLDAASVSSAARAHTV